MKYETRHRDLKEKSPQMRKTSTHTLTYMSKEWSLSPYLNNKKKRISLWFKKKLYHIFLYSLCCGCFWDKKRFYFSFLKNWFKHVEKLCVLKTQKTRKKLIQPQQKKGYSHFSTHSKIIPYLLWYHPWNTFLGVL